MATYYVRPDGLDAHTGTGPAAADAWLTIGKALGAAGIASGDTVYIAPGVYREAVTVAMTSATVETFVIGDVAASQFTDLQGGDVIWTAYTTNDKTAPAASSSAYLNSRDFLTFEDILFVGGSGSPSVINLGSGSTDIMFRRCAFITGARAQPLMTGTAIVGVAANWTWENCLFQAGNGNIATLTLPTSSVADYDAEIIFRNCFGLGSSHFASVGASGANSSKGGGVKVYDSTALLFSTNGSLITIGTASVASSAGNQCEAYNNLVYSNATALSATTLGQIVEDYNYLIALTPRTNVDIGANSVSTSTSLTYALLVHLGQEQLWGQYPRPFFSPMLLSPLLGFGNDGSIGVQTQDAFGVPRPSGPGPTWANALKAIGYSERPNTWAKETGTVRTGTNCIACAGPGVKDINLPVDPVSTTVSVYMRYDGTYAGTKPSMQVRNGEECGVTSATTTMAGAANNWEQLTLNFTPTRQGIVTIRFVSSDTNGGGKAFADDLSVA